MSVVATYLLQRPEDLVVIGVRWSGPDPVGGDLVAPAEGGVLTLLFPPQHIAEQVEMVGSDPQMVGAIPVWRSQLSAPSIVAFDIAPGTRVPLTVEGVLAVTAASAPRSEGTALEIPWRLHLRPDAASWRHSSVPVTSPDGATGLWRTRAAEPSSPVEVTVLQDGAAETDDPFPIALAAADRMILAEQGSVAPAFARRLELTTLGGSLSATGRWPGFAWDHQASLGRDIVADTVTAVRMFPFGHRAEIESLTQRVFDTASGTAALRKTVTLEFIDPVVTTAPDDARFPFDTAEVLQTTFTDLPLPAWVTMQRGSGTLAELKAALDARFAEREALAPAVQAEQTRVREPYELSGWWDADELARLEAAMAPLVTAIADADAQWQAAQPDLDRLQDLADEADRLSREPYGPDGAQEPWVIEALRQNAAEYNEINDRLKALPRLIDIQNWRDQVAPMEAAAVPLRATVWAERTRVRSVEELAAAGMQAAVDTLRLTQEIAQLTPAYEAEAAASIHPHPWYVLASGVNGALRIPVRLTGREGDVDIEIPMIAVREFFFEQSGALPAFDSVTDPSTIAAVTALWDEQAAGIVATTPTRVDLVRDDRRARRARVDARFDVDVDVSPAAGDVRVVHALGIVGSVVEGRYRAALESFTITLPEIDALVPTRPPLPPVLYRYAQEFLDDPASDLLFETVGDAVDISFLDDARNAGALLSPRIAADALSRELGPVAADAVREAVGDVIDPATLFAEGATLLGFDLADILAEISRAKVPAIVNDIVAGRPPVVRMTWDDVPLKSFGPLIATDTTVALTVEIGPDGARVECTLTAFEFALPTPATELLRVTFGGLKYEMLAGSAPSLEIVGGLGARFVGELRLLEKLGDAVGLGDNGPRVTAGRDGISARYELAVPPVTTAGFQLRDITFRAGVDIPFGKTPPSVAIAFASREKPFLATVLMFGGGGYFDLVLDQNGIRSLEASIEFGASIGVNFLIVEAEMHVLGGFRYAQTGDTIALSGYLRMGGSVKILGLITVSVEILLALTYQSAGNQLVGRATLVLEIDLTLYSTSVELDTGPWYISGGPASAAPESLDADGRATAERVDPDLFVEQWQQYRSAFA